MSGSGLSPCHKVLYQAYGSEYAIKSVNEKGTSWTSEEARLKAETLNAMSLYFTIHKSWGVKFFTASISIF